MFRCNFFYQVNKCFFTCCLLGLGLVHYNLAILGKCCLPPQKEISVKQYNKNETNKQKILLRKYDDSISTAFGRGIAYILVLTHFKS